MLHKYLSRAASPRPKLAPPSLLEKQQVRILSLEKDPREKCGHPLTWNFVNAEKKNLTPGVKSSGSPLSGSFVVGCFHSSGAIKNSAEVLRALECHLHAGHTERECQRNAYIVQMIARLPRLLYK
ncbi:hypothetical protein JTE90_002669 [Oedothorax gibbosus]|uniref:Uncharacterized protein n=1 Tax=Oedothorax gibbosus TaxID=931172 RepID=A0AAV6U0S2_9ARAC|nr:hypothetical protein JTE90_002669 [Oedothorax gibbosus]